MRFGMIGVMTVALWAMPCLWGGEQPKTSKATLPGTEIGILERKVHGGESGENADYKRVRTDDRYYNRQIDTVKNGTKNNLRKVSIRVSSATGFPESKHRIGGNESVGPDVHVNNIDGAISWVVIKADGTNRAVLGGYLPFIDKSSPEQQSTKQDGLHPMVFRHRVHGRVILEDGGTGPSDDRFDFYARMRMGREKDIHAYFVKPQNGNVDGIDPNVGPVIPEFKLQRGKIRGKGAERDWVTIELSVYAMDGIDTAAGPSFRCAEIDKGGDNKSLTFDWPKTPKAVLDNGNLWKGEVRVSASPDDVKSLRKLKISFNYKDSERASVVVGIVPVPPVSEFEVVQTLPQPNGGIVKAPGPFQFLCDQSNQGKMTLRVRLEAKLNTKDNNASQKPKFTLEAIDGIEPMWKPDDNPGGVGKYDQSKGVWVARAKYEFSPTEMVSVEECEKIATIILPSESTPSATATFKVSATELGAKFTNPGNGETALFVFESGGLKDHEGHPARFDIKLSRPLTAQERQSSKLALAIAKLPSSPNPPTFVCNGKTLSVSDNNDFWRGDLMPVFVDNHELTEFSIKINYPDLPKNNKDFGVKKASLLFTKQSNENELCIGKYALFFDPEDNRHPDGHLNNVQCHACSAGKHCPNWFYYWSQGACKRLKEFTYMETIDDNSDISGRYDGKLWIAFSAFGYGEIVPLVRTFMWNNEAAGGSCKIGSAYAYGIEQIAAVMTHEFMHKHLAGHIVKSRDNEQPLNRKDIKGDGMQDDWEISENRLHNMTTSTNTAQTDPYWSYHLGIVSDPNNKDTYGFATASRRNYATYADEEIRARKAEQMIENEIDYQLDWSKKGFQWGSIARQ